MPSYVVASGSICVQRPYSSAHRKQKRCFSPGLSATAASTDQRGGGFTVCPESTIDSDIVTTNECLPQKTAWVDSACSDCPDFLLPGGPGALARRFIPGVSGSPPELRLASWPHSNTFLDLLLRAPEHLCNKGKHSSNFCNTMGAHTESSSASPKGPDIPGFGSMIILLQIQGFRFGDLGGSATHLAERGKVRQENMTAIWGLARSMLSKCLGV